MCRRSDFQCALVERDKRFGRFRAVEVAHLTRNSRPTGRGGLVVELVSGAFFESRRAWRGVERGATDAEVVRVVLAVNAHSLWVGDQE
jgi:hypothetical protein